MKKTAVIGILSLAMAMSALADVSITDSSNMQRAWRQQKADEKLNKQRHRSEGPTSSAEATGSATLTDSLGVQYFFNTNITFATSSSASGAASEASYTGPVNATTSLGGTVSSTLNDMFDGYNALCVSFNGSTGPCATGDPNYSIYNQNGPQLPAELSGRQIVLPAKTMGALSVQRKMYVPTTDSYARWMNIFTNTSGASVTFNAITSNNLGSDANTTVVMTSSGDATATAADTWVTSFQNYSGTTSSDPRIGHIFGAVQGVNFVNGDDNPYWYNTITLAPGQTAIVLHFVTGQASKAAAQAKATSIITAPPTVGMSQAEIGQVVNFALSSEIIPALSGWGLMSLAMLLVAAGFVALRFHS